MSPEERHEMEEKRKARRHHLEAMMHAAMKDADELDRHPGPYTWGIAFHDGWFIQFFDRDGKPCLGDDLREPEDAAWLLTMLNRPYTTPTT
jgi:hypothetical protein